MLNLLTGTGRTNRLGYLCTSIAIAVVSSLVIFPIALSLEVDENDNPILSGTAVLVLLTVGLASMWLNYANTTRRFHDLGHSGWMTLTLYIPILGLAVSLYLFFGAGNPTRNKYGNAPSPLFGSKQSVTPADREWLIHAQQQAQAAQDASYYDADGNYDMNAMFK